MAKLGMPKMERSAAGSVAILSPTKRLMDFPWLAAAARSFVKVTNGDATKSELLSAISFW
jgi:hypothetical protein